MTLQTYFDDFFMDLKKTKKKTINANNTPFETIQKFSHK